MLSKRIISAAIILAGATLLSSGTAFGTPSVPFLDLTEDSSSSLTALLTGTTVAVSVFNPSPDTWILTFANSNGGVPVTGSGSWTEPDPGSTEGNFVGVNGLASLIVMSDAPDQAGMANGTIDTTGFTLDNGVMQVRFTDNGDGTTTSVPDATSTLPLLSLSLAALGIFAKRKKV